MERAAFGIAQHSLALLAARGPIAGAKIAMLIGSGNNGADALVAAAQLAKRPVHLTVYLTQPPAKRSRVHQAALARLSRLQVRVVDLFDRTDLAPEVQELVRADLLLDALLGIGATGPVRGVLGEVLRALNSALDLSRGTKTTKPKTRRPILVAVDVPTGVDSSSGVITELDTVFWADHTLTFGGYKTGTLVGPGALAAGEVHLIDIGLPIAATRDQVHVLQYQDLGSLGIVGMPAVTAHKFTAGVVGQITGSSRYPGAGVLSAAAALASGAGLVRCVGSPNVVCEIRLAHPEVVGHPEPGVTQGEQTPAPVRVDAWVWGSGVAAGSGQEARIVRASENLGLGAQHSDPSQPAHPHTPVPQVIDAGALTLLGQGLLRPDPLMVLTPHAGELAALLTALTGRKVTRVDVESDPLGHARKAQQLVGAVVVLKGPVTVIAGPHATFAQRDGTARMATAGSGDVLAGLLGSLLAQHYPTILDSTSIAAAAVLVHGLSGRVAAGELVRGNTGGAQWQQTGRSHPITATKIAQALPAVLQIATGGKELC